MGRKSSKNRKRAGDDLSQSGETASPGTSDKSTNRPVKKTRTVATTGESSSRMIDDAINSVLSQSIDLDFDADGDDVGRSDDATIAGLVKKVNEQQETICKLSQQVSFLLSYLGVDDKQLTTAQSQQSMQPQPQPQPPSSVLSGAAVGDIQSLAPKSFASITASRPVPLSTALKQSVVSAVYRDFEDRDRRSKNIVVNGMPVGRGNDVAAVKYILDNEFGRAFTVVKTRRLGCPQSGRVQPLLVTLESPVQAAFVTQNARQLRQSSDDDIRNSVYINPDVTRAEAFAAYQNRVERRKRDAGRQRGDQSSSSSQLPPTTNVRQSQTAATGQQSIVGRAAAVPPVPSSISPVDPVAGVSTDGGLHQPSAAVPPPSSPSQAASDVNVPAQQTLQQN